MIPADLRSAVYSTVLKNGDASSLEALMRLFKKADLHEERVRLMRTMGTVTQPELIKKVLDFSLSVSLKHLTIPLLFSFSFCFPFCFFFFFHFLGQISFEIICMKFSTLVHDSNLRQTSNLFL